MSLKTALKQAIFRFLGKDPEAVVVAVVSGEEAPAQAMAEELRRLVPDRRHFIIRLGAAAGWEREPVVGLEPGSVWSLFRQLRRAFRRFRIGQAAVLFGAGAQFSALRTAVFLLAPGKILAYNFLLERHHLRLRCGIASLLFLRGVPLDRIFLRPRWLCPWKKDRSSTPLTFQVLQGRPLSDQRPRVAVLSPYFPYPLSHGGAVRIYHLMREAARRFDLFLFAFTEEGQPVEAGPVMDFCAQAVLVPKPRYREPRWSSLLPPEVHEYESSTMRRLLAAHLREHSIGLLQTEYTQLAKYGGDVLVEHDVTFDLYAQVHSHKRSLSSWWDLRRWVWFERRVARRFRGVVTMSEKDKTMLGLPHSVVIPNGVDLERFRPSPEQPGKRLLFIGSFRHFPNIVAFRFLMEQVWPLLRREFPDLSLTVVAGPSPEVFWSQAAGTPMPPAGPGVRLLGFVRDVAPLYQEANLVLAPTLVSAGTNVKVLEAMAMGRAVLSTSSGCAGLGLEHGRTVWIADGAPAFADGIRRLILDSQLRDSLARAARLHAERRFGWRALGTMQRRLWDSLLGNEVEIRPAAPDDLPDIAAIQEASPEASLWPPQDYLAGGCLVAAAQGHPVGFLAYRRSAEGESEILNLAVAPSHRRRGIATRLAEEVVAQLGGSLFLEVRESNVAARNLYKKLGFSELGRRRSYYASPPEDGIVMKLQSC